VTKCDRDEGYLVLYLSDEPRDIFLEQMKAITEIYLSNKRSFESVQSVGTDH
jgi:hypothetical protein